MELTNILKLEAFKVNSVDYLLKSIKPEELERALLKFGKWTQAEMLKYLSRLTQLMPTQQRYKDRILIPVKDKLVPIDLREVSCFYTTDRNARIYLKNGSSYPYSKTLEQIFTSLNPAEFKEWIVSE